MASRRTFLKAGVAACAAAAAVPALNQPAPALGQPLPPSCYKLVFDDRFAAARAFASAMAAREVPTAAIRGDVTHLFVNDLDLRWKQGPVVMAGYTTQASLFCLDLLARDRGMRVIHSAPKPRGDAALVFWIIAPKEISAAHFEL